jgi:cell division protein ZipA
MWELRWVLLGLGALLVVGVYLWSRGVFKRRARPGTHQTRTEPTLGEPLRDFEVSSDAAPAAPQTAPKPSRQAPERIVALRLIPRSEELGSERAVQALQGVGLEHGRYGIFHRLDELHGDDAVFSVASLTEPGTFDLENLGESTIAGLSFFVVLPGVGDPVARFDNMIETARALAVELDGDLHDERGSSWSVQRERYVREELIDYRHQLERP